MNTKQILHFARIISWILFIGLCIKAGAIIISFIVSIFVNPAAAKDLYLGLDLSMLYEFSTQYYIHIVSFLIAIAVLKAYLFYLVSRIFLKIDFDNPFNSTVQGLISKISYFSLTAGLLAVIANRYSEQLLKKGMDFQIDWGSSEFLFMAGIVFIIAILFKGGIEIQSENDLTI
jgi:hypothetical protein